MSQEEYDQLWAANWGDQQHYGPVHRRQREALLKLVAKLNPQTVIDVGCGAGDMLGALAQAMPYLELSGTDLSIEALELARTRVTTAKLKQLDIEKGSLAETFDLVICNQVIEHLIDDSAALYHLGLMAKKYVLVATMRGRMRKSESQIGHIRNYSDVELRAKAERAGLEVVEIFGWGFPFYSPLYRTMIEWIPAGPPSGKFGTAQRVIANFLYGLYGFNIPRHGDVVTMLARPHDLKSKETLHGHC